MGIPSLKMTARKWVPLSSLLKQLGTDDCRNIVALSDYMQSRGRMSPNVSAPDSELTLAIWRSDGGPRQHQAHGCWRSSRG